MGARQAVEFLLLLVAKDALELFQVLQAQGLREIVVELGLARDLHALDRHGEDCRGALQLFGRIVVGESHVDLALVADLGADQLLLESRDQLARAQLDLHVAAGAAFERRSVDAAGEVHDDQVAGGGGMALLGVGPVLVGAGETLKLLVDGAVVAFDRQPLELQAVDVGGGDLRQGLEADADLGILAGLVIFLQRDLRLHRRAKLLLLQQLLHAGLHRIVQRVLLDRFAMHLADEVRRNLAGTEAGHAHLRSDALDLLVDAGVDILRGDGQHERPLEALIFRLNRLDHCSIPSKIVCFRPMNGWCARRESNPHVFRHWNLNPARLPVPPRARGHRARTSRARCWSAAIARIAAGATVYGLAAFFRAKGHFMATATTTRDPDPQQPQPSQPGQPTPAAAGGAARPAGHRRSGAGHANPLAEPHPADRSELGPAPQPGAGRHHFEIGQRVPVIMGARCIEEHQVQPPVDHGADRPALAP